MSSFFRKISILCLMCLVLSACSDKPKAQGVRLSVADLDKTLTPDIMKEELLSFRLPKPVRNILWSQPGGNAAHYIPHPALSAEPKQVWVRKIGTGTSDEAYLLATPVVDEDYIYAMDSSLKVSKYDLKNGQLIWSRSLNTDEDNEVAVKGIGLALDKNRLFIATGLKRVLALNTENGETIWEYEPEFASRSAPAVAEGKVFIVTSTNLLVVLDEETGKLLWTNQAARETTSLLGNGAAAVKNGTVVVPFSSGEVKAFDTDSGMMFWSDLLAARRVYNTQSNMTHISANPVICQETVILGGNANMSMAVDLKTGERRWIKEIGINNQPFVSEQITFLLSNTNEVVALHTPTGKVLWTYQMESFENASEKEKQLLWQGPVLAGNRLILAGSDGRVLSLSPLSGEVLGWDRLPSGTHLPPIAVQGKLIFLTDNAELVVYE